MDNKDIQKNHNNQQGISALLLVISITTLTIVSAVVMAMINTTNTISNYQLTEKNKVQYNMESCINDAMWRINDLKQTEGVFNMGNAGVACTYKISATTSGLKTVTTTASTTASFGNWQETVVLSVNVSSTPVNIDTYKDSNYYDTVTAVAAVCGDWTCSGGETCSTCSVDCGACYCGNGTCAGTETASNCSADCPAVCGDTNCTHTENASTCAADCLASCGDTYCTHSETCNSCSTDCGTCPGVPSGVIVAWPSTNASIPSGWTRVESFDEHYLEGTTADPSATPGGATTHTHTSPTHTHTIGHTHNGNTGAASGTYDTKVGAGASASGHTHTITTASASGSNVAASANLGTAYNDPPHVDVIWIQSDGTPTGIPNSAWVLFDSDTLPTNWSRQAGNKFLKGAAFEDDGGATGGSSDAHIHTDSGHTHTESAHTHTGTTGQGGSSFYAVVSGSAGAARSTHTHTISGGNATAIEVSGVGAVANGDAQPPFYKLNIIQNNTGSANYPNNIIAMWSGTVASIPSGWVICDGNHVCPNLNDKFIKGANADSEINATGGATTHTHTAGTGHTHTINSHTHSFTVSAGTTAKYEDTSYAPDGSTAASQAHTHTLSLSGGGTNGSATITASANTDNRPVYKEIVFIQYQGGVAMNENTSPSKLAGIDAKAEVFGSSYSIKSIFSGIKKLAVSWINNGVAFIVKYNINGSLWPIESKNTVVKYFDTNYKLITNFWLRINNTEKKTVTNQNQVTDNSPVAYCITPQR